MMAPEQALFLVDCYGCSSASAFETFIGIYDNATEQNVWNMKQDFLCAIRKTNQKNLLDC